MYIGLVSVVVITFALHAKGHWFNPSMRQYLIKQLLVPLVQWLTHDISNVVIEVRFLGGISGLFIWRYSSVVEHTIPKTHVNLAQLGERQTEDLEVAGSSPAIDNFLFDLFIQILMPFITHFSLSHSFLGYLDIYTRYTIQDYLIIYYYYSIL